MTQYPDDIIAEMMRATGISRAAASACWAVVSKHQGWRPIETLPKAGKFLVASYAPTNWAYWVGTVVVYEADNPHTKDSDHGL